MERVRVRPRSQRECGEASALRVLRQASGGAARGQLGAPSKVIGSRHRQACAPVTGDRGRSVRAKVARAVSGERASRSRSSS